MPNDGRPSPPLPSPSPSLPARRAPGRWRAALGAAILAGLATSAWLTAAGQAPAPLAEAPVADLGERPDRDLPQPGAFRAGRPGRPAGDAAAAPPATALEPLAPGAAAGAAIGAEALLPRDSRQRHARYTRFRPGRGQVVDLDPPRFSWPYSPEIVEVDATYPAHRRFTLQIAASPDFSTPLVEIRDTPYNFFNFLPPLGGTGPWYWRVGYDTGTSEEHWSEAQWFRLAPNAAIWDRSGFTAALARPRPHPRLFLDPTRLAELRDLGATEAGREGWASLVGSADSALAESWWTRFPAGDCPPGTAPGNPECTLDFEEVGRRLAAAAFVYKLTGEPRFARARDHFLALASYPPGGWSSPEGSNPGLAYNPPTHLAHYLGLFYDWFHDDLSAAERSRVVASLEWRIERTLDRFAWTRPGAGGSLTIEPESLAVIGWSHQYEALMPAVIGALAIYDESAAARRALALGLHYLVGITNSYGEDEAWNEGPGYGNDKFANLLDAVAAIDIALPELGLARHLAPLSAYAEFLARVTPAGARHSAFGNRAHHFWDWARNRARAQRLVGFLRGDGAALADAAEMGRLLAEIGHSPARETPWVDYVLPVFYPAPHAARHPGGTGLFALEGWLTAGTASPSDREAQRQAVAVTFQARPRGGYGHSFASDNAFDLHAYGETVAVGGGSTDNQLEFPRRSMSHNTVLVGGEGQQWSAVEDYGPGDPRGPRLDRATPVRARLLAYAERTVDGVPVTYWAGDATAAYPAAAGLERFIRHLVLVDGAWLALFDDLALKPGRAADFQWLYHIVPGSTVPLAFDRPTFTFRYSVGGTGVVVRHLAGTAGLDFLDLLGAEGQVNVAKCGLDPAPGACAEDYRRETTAAGSRTGVLDAHHLWIGTTAARPDARFLAAIVPFREGLDAEPVIARHGPSERALRVGFRGREISVSFDPAVAADLVIDAAAIAAAAGR